MFNPFSRFIGARYVRAKRRNQFISFISLTSTIGIALGVIVMITVLSVMNGFAHEVKSRILSMASHATVKEFGDHMKNWESISGKVSAHPEIEGIAPFLRKEGMMTFNSRVHGAVIRGVLPEQEVNVSIVNEKIVQGDFDDLVSGEFNIAIGVEMARALGASLGDKITLVAPQANATPAGIVPRYKRFTVVAIFEIGMHEFDSGLALIHIEDAQKLFKLKGPQGLRLKTSDIFAAARISRDIMNTIPGRFWIIDWTQTHKNWFEAIKMEKTVMFFLLIMIIAVAAFNIISTLVMMVNDKRSDIAVLRTLGASPNTILKIFMFQGTVIGLIGLVLGNILGILLALNVPNLVSGIEKLFGVDLLNSEVYYISDIPSKIEWGDVVFINIATFLICFLMTIYPAKRAANVPPAEALRYE